MSKTLRKIKKIEYRALPEETKGLQEKRNDLLEEMEGLVNKAKSEVRALTEEEDTRFDEIKKEIESIDKTIEKEEETRSLADKKVVKKENKKEERSQEQINNEELRSIFKEEREATPAAYHTNTQSQLALYVYTDSAYTRKGLIGYGADLYMDGKPKDDGQVAGIYNVAEKAV